MKYNLGIVLYNPSQKNIDQISKYIKNNTWNKVFVYYNSETKIGVSGENIVELGEGKNLGLAVPYNLFLKNSCDVDYLCILDQDSFYDEKEINKMLNYINHNNESLKDVGIVAPRSYAEISRKLERKDALTEAQFVINSGSFVNIQFINKNGIEYDENIFLDGVDVDFCWNIRQHDGKVLIYENSILYQSLGETKDGHKCNHAPIRFYYIVSARKYMYQKYKGRIVGWVLSALKTIGTIVKILIKESGPINKIKQCIRGQFSKERREN